MTRQASGQGSWARATTRPSVGRASSHTRSTRTQGTRTRGEGRERYLYLWGSGCRVEQNNLLFHSIIILYWNKINFTKKGETVPALSQTGGKAIHLLEVRFPKRNIISTSPREKVSTLLFVVQKISRWVGFTKYF